jgi:hypothetical protein
MAKFRKQSMLKHKKSDNRKKLKFKYKFSSSSKSHGKSVQTLAKINAIIRKLKKFNPRILHDEAHAKISAKYNRSK